MRNTLQYPITLDEICEALEQAAQDILNRDICGDMRPVLYDEAIKFMRLAEKSGLTYEQSIHKQEV